MLRVPDPTDPTGQKFIMVPASALEAVQPQNNEKPSFGADVGVDTSSSQARPAKKGKKKKKKRLVVQDQDPQVAEAKQIEGQITALDIQQLNPPSEKESSVLIN